MYPLRYVTGDEVNLCGDCCTQAHRTHTLVADFTVDGNPTTITSDPGSQCTSSINEVIADLSTLAQTKVLKTTAYSNKENAIVASANKEVLRHLRANVTELKSFDKWN